jgi:hypothetical protein
MDPTAEPSTPPAPQNEQVRTALTQPVLRSELVAWYPVAHGQKSHAFAQDPDTKVFRLISLCRPGLSANTGKSAGPSCPDCERIVRFLHAEVQKHRDIGRREGHACKLMHLSLDPSATAAAHQEPSFR